jgi:catechol 2,3-dioxygenase-like lactoylglutathione lyase family enzyme
MLGRIATVTITAPDLPAAVAAYQRYLGYRVVDDGALGRDIARSWGRPQLAGNRAVLLEPASGAETYLRFVQGPAYVEYEPRSCLGWNAAGLVVQDVDALAAELAGSPFRIVGPPADLSFIGQARAMRLVGPAREVLHLTQVKQKVAAFDTPEAASFVDHVFSVMLGGASLEALQDYYHAQFGVPRAVAVPSAASALPLSGQCCIEVDQMPPATANRPCVPGQLPPGAAMVTFEIDSLPGQLPSSLGPAHRSPGLPYAGRRSQACVGAAGELIELIESG